jgi:hypothetical protein
MDELESQPNNKAIFPHHALPVIGLGLGVATAAVMLAPTILPLLGVGDSELAQEAVLVMHGTGLGSGFAGQVNQLLNSVPYIGETLSQASFKTAGIVGATGIGGYLLGKFIEKRESDNSFSLGKTIRYASLATSALIALPAALTSIGVGIVYLAATLSGPELANQAIDFFIQTTGVTGEAGVAAAGLSGIAATLPHLLTCGVPLIPAFLHLHAHRKDKKDRLLAVSEAEIEALSHKYSDGSITLDISPESPLKKGNQTKIMIQMRNATTGVLLSPEDLDMVHTEKMHLFVVDESLKDYHHIHPTYNAETQAFECSFTPNTNHSYRCWADITTAKDKQNHKLLGVLQGEASRAVTPRILMQSETNVGGLNFTWDSPEPLQQGKDAIVSVHVQDETGNAVHDLQPVMGAFAHLVGFSADKQSVIHCHPLGAEPTHDSERGGPLLRFHVKPDTVGDVQFYVQVRRDNKDIYAPIGQRVKSPEKYTEKLESQPAIQHGLACG